MSRITHDKVQELLSASKRALEDYKNPLEFLNDLYDMLKETRLNSWNLLEKSEGEISNYISVRLEQSFCESDEDDDDNDSAEENEEKLCSCNNCCVCDEQRGKENERYQLYLNTRGSADVGKPQCTQIFGRGTYMGQKCERPVTLGTAQCEECQRNYPIGKVLRQPASSPSFVTNSAQQPQQFQALQFQQPQLFQGPQFPQFRQPQQFPQIQQPWIAPTFPPQR
ncbi:MAG: hypothetical protein Solivirus1_18 [Solivirus sp.]|uniref:Uncharacterized protein n=1 Tax=Solivirus sp. TaxID=2487772 RepID=A0A3G5AHT7_9VIRU|nr:MAG: hypothetical protein Solivirus1_18 [Solivirus sp.]